MFVERSLLFPTALLLVYVTGGHAQINLLGVIYGADGAFCDAFYWSRPLCQGQMSCTIPLSPLVCTDASGKNYGHPLPLPINVMHANYECASGSTFFSVNKPQARDKNVSMTISCRTVDENLSIARTPADSPFDKLPVRVTPQMKIPRTITTLGAVIGGDGIYCDAYFRAAEKCNGSTTCTLQIDKSLCQPGLGHPNPNNDLNFLHLMYSCGGLSFSRKAVRALNRNATMTC